VRGGRVAIVVVFVVSLGLVQAGNVLACSCLPRTPSESLQAADAAVVGRLLSVAPRGMSRAAYRYRVVRVYKGGGEIERGTAITVLGGRGSAACGLPTRTGRNYGLFLLGQGGRWVSGLCGVIAPRRLGAAARRPRQGEAGAAAISCAG
jgi:hypothetical protein